TAEPSVFGANPVSAAEAMVNAIEGPPAPGTLGADEGFFSGPAPATSQVMGAGLSDVVSVPAEAGFDVAAADEATNEAQTLAAIQAENAPAPAVAPAPEAPAPTAQTAPGTSIGPANTAQTAAAQEAAAGGRSDQGSLSTGAAAGAGTGSVLSQLGTLAQIGGFGLSAAALAGLAARGQGNVPPAARQAQAVATPFAQSSTQTLANANAGLLTAPQEALVEKFINDQTNDLRQKFFRMGRDPDNDTAFGEGLANIRQQAVAMREQFISADFTRSIQQGALATGVDLSVAQIQTQLKTQFDNALASAVGNFARVSAGTGQSLTRTG